MLGSNTSGARALDHGSKPTDCDFLYKKRFKNAAIARVAGEVVQRETRALGARFVVRVCLFVIILCTLFF